VHARLRASSSCLTGRATRRYSIDPTTAAGHRRSPSACSRLCSDGADTGSQIKSEALDPLPLARSLLSQAPTFQGRVPLRASSCLLPPMLNCICFLEASKTCYRWPGSSVLPSSFVPAGLPVRVLSEFRRACAHHRLPVIWVLVLDHRPRRLGGADGDRGMIIVSALVRARCLRCCSLSCSTAGCWSSARCSPVQAQGPIGH
jgi:hypothetical protein